MIPTTPGTIPRPWLFTMVLGVILFFLGVFVAIRPLFTHNASLTGTRWLDWAFAVVFMLRGVLNIKTALRRRARAMAQG